MSEKPSVNPNEEGMTRRDFIKTLGKGVAVTALGGGGAILAGCEAGITPEEAAKEMEAAPTESMEVVAWGQALSEEDAKKPRTVDELRSNAGWARQVTDAFIDYLHKKYPDQVTSDGTIQPGSYEVPLKRPE